MIGQPHHHPVVLRGLAGNGVYRPPTLVQTAEQNFIPALLERLRTEEGRTELITGSASPSNPTLVPFAPPTDTAGRPRLRQPIHRIFNVVLVEAVCLRPGRPRLDPRDIEGAGIVIRRLAASRTPQSARTQSSPPPEPDFSRPAEGWFEAGKILKGWLPLPFPATAEGLEARADADPDPARHRLPYSSGHPVIDLRLWTRHRSGPPPTEQVIPLFVAPPEICAAAGKTLLYGLVPVTSSETSDAADTVPFTAEDLLPSIPSYLTAAGQPRMLPYAGIPMTASQAEALDSLDLDSPDPQQLLRPQRLLRDYILMLRQLKVWGALDGNGGPIRQHLDSLSFTFQSTLAILPPRSVGAQLLQHFTILVERTGEPVPWPDAWPAVPEAAATGIIDAITAETNRQLNALRLREKRFDRTDAFYRLRAFIRVRNPAPCPTQTTWSPPSAVYSIVPWYESDGVPVHTIQLPEVTPSSVRRFRPNVAFQVPATLANLLNKTSPKKFLEGKGASTDGPDLGWICGFSIPIITLCAFIVLNIFLQLLNIIFWWLFFIKICIPFPKRR